MPPVCRSLLRSCRLARHLAGHLGHAVVHVAQVLAKAGQLLPDALHHVLHVLAGILEQLLPVGLGLIELLTHPREFFGKCRHRMFLFGWGVW